MPDGSMMKFFREQGGSDHGGKLHWPGTPDGFPFRGAAAPHLKQDEVEQIRLALDYKSSMFRLWIPDEKAAFDVVMDRIANSWYMKNHREDKWNEEHQHYLVWLEWVQIYGETPNGKSPSGTAPSSKGSKTDGNGDTITVQEGQPSQLSYHAELGQFHGSRQAGPAG